MWTLEDNYLLESAGVIDISFLHHFAWRRFLIMACKRLLSIYQSGNLVYLYWQDPLLDLPWGHQT